MTFPAGVTLCEVTIPSSAVWQGGASAITATFTPTRPVTHRRSNTPLAAVTGNATTPSGLSVLVPHGQQHGYCDDKGNSIAKWEYDVVATYRNTANVLTMVKKQIQIPAGATSIDLLAARDWEPSGNAGLPARLSEAAIAAKISTVAMRRPESDLYEPSRGALRKWRALRGAVLAGERQGRISCLGDSITFGAAETGNSNPKYNTSWPGRLRSRLNAAYGKGGTGLVIANPDILATPTLDNRFTITGAVTTGATGAFRDGAMTLPVGTAVEFTAECDGFTVYTLSGAGGHVSVKIDGVQTGLIRNTSSTSGATIASTYTGRNVIAPVAAGALGTHTIKIEPTSATVTLIGIEGTIAGAGRFSVSTTAISGKSLKSGGFIDTNNDETNAQYGRPILIDLPRADMHVLALGINDVQTGIPTADIKTGMTTAVLRARMAGTNTQGVPYANSDALVVITPGFQTGAATYDAYKEAMYQVADEQNVALLDLSNRWGPWADATGLGMFADTIHPTDRGADDIAAAVHWALFNR